MKKQSSNDGNLCLTRKPNEPIYVEVKDPSGRTIGSCRVLIRFINGRQVNLVLTGKPDMFKFHRCHPLLSCCDQVMFSFPVSFLKKLRIMLVACQECGSVYLFRNLLNKESRVKLPMLIGDLYDIYGIPKDILDRKDVKRAIKGAGSRAGMKEVWEAISPYALDKLCIIRQG